MPDFVCRVATATGEIVERTYSADDEGALRHDLENQDLLVLNLRRTNSLVDQVARTFRLRGSISQRDFLAFNKEFVALIRAGLPILSSLEILTERRKNPTFRRALVDIRERVKSGEALSDAFTAHGSLFPRLYSASLASGERSGELGTVIARFVDYSARVLAIQRKVVSALIYPAILLTLSTGLIALMMFVIIPKFNEFLKDFGQDLPLLTKLVVGLAMLCRSYWHVILLALVSGIATLVLWTRTPAGRAWFDALKLRVPLIGRVIGDYAQSRFTRTLATLQAGGIPLVTSIELSGGRGRQRDLRAQPGRRRQSRARGQLVVGVARPDRADGRHHDPDGQGRRVDGCAGRDAEPRIRLHGRGDRHPAEPPGHVDRAADARVHGRDRRRRCCSSIYLPLIRVYGAAV